MIKRIIFILILSGCSNYSNLKEQSCYTLVYDYRCNYSEQSIKILNKMKYGYETLVLNHRLNKTSKEYISFDMLTNYAAIKPIDCIGKLK